MALDAEDARGVGDVGCHFGPVSMRLCVRELFEVGDCGDGCCLLSCMCVDSALSTLVLSER